MHRTPTDVFPLDRWAVANATEVVARILLDWRQAAVLPRQPNHKLEGRLTILLP
nr:hypothetical protein [Nitrosomonas nitrosa]